MRDKVNWQVRINQLLSNKRNKSYINTFATVLFILFMSLAGIIPAISSLGNQYEENSKRDNLISDLNEKLEGLKSLLGESEQKVDLITYFDKVFPETINQDNIVKLILSLSDESNVVIDSFSFEELSNADQAQANAKYGLDVKVLNLILTGDGSQTEVLDFLNRVEDSALVLDIKDLTLSKLVTSNSLDVRYSFDMSLYYFYYSKDIVNE